MPRNSYIRQALHVLLWWLRGKPDLTQKPRKRSGKCAECTCSSWCAGGVIAGPYGPIFPPCDYVDHEILRRDFNGKV